MKIIMAKHRQLAEQAVKQWLENDCSKAGITERINSMLSKARDKALLQLLGFEYEYNGQFRVDHCNGRSGESFIGDHIRNVCREI